MSTIFSPKSVTGDIDVGHVSNRQYLLDCCFGDIDIPQQVLEKPEGCRSNFCNHFVCSRINIDF